MKRKARIQTGIDDRLVAIYARKSRITNKGDSIGVQFKQSADYAINQLSLPEDYEFARYEDKGLSGYYSDRPDFQRLLRDIEMGKIKAVACYKLDRISRKTSDLMRLLEYFERHDVTLLVCSNNINTRISTSKIIIQVLAIIAEFERDILTERIQDNLMELAKDGRWLGGKTPTGFSSQRVTTGSGKNKSAISFLVPVQEEKEIVLEIYGTFWETRSLLQTANIINEKYETKHGAKFTTSTIRLILRNPIYCVADEYSYNYFLEHDGNLFGEPSDFDGQHGLTAYNKTDQMKVEDEDSTFFNPKFSQLLTRKPISEWIVSVGRHEGFISSRKWVETQNMLDEIAEKYNRPHRKTNALLSGLMYCPICGKRLRVLPESNRWTNGKPRFKYACPGVRAKECTFKGVEGVTLDEFVIHSLSSLQEEHSDYYRQLLENRVASMIRTDQSEKEYQETKKAIERLNADIAAQVRNLREADDALKRFIQDDIKELTDELAKREAALRRMEDTQSENQYLIHELNGMKKRLLSFEEFAKGAQPEALFTLVHSIVDRIYITTDGTKQKCQVYIKGCATEDYSDVLGAAGYIEEEPLLPVASYVPPMCDLDYYSILNSHLGSIGSQQGGVHAVKVSLLGIGGSPCTFVHGDIRQGDDGAMDTQDVFVVSDGGIGFSRNGGILRKRIGAGALIHLVTAAGHLPVVAGAALPHRLRIAGYLRALCKEQLIAAHGQQKNISFRKLIGRMLDFAFINSRFLQIQYHGFTRIGHSAGHFGWFIALLSFAGYLSVGHLRRFAAALPFTGHLSIRHLGRFHVILSLAGRLTIRFCRGFTIFLFLRRFQQRQSHTGAVQRGHPAIYTFCICFFRSGGGFACR